jgi:hypothetical protein
MFPFDTLLSLGVGEYDSAGQVLHFPVLRFVVEFNVAGAGDFKGADRMQVDQFGVKTGSGAIGAKCNVGYVHNLSGGWCLMFLGAQGLRIEI